MKKLLIIALFLLSFTAMARPVFVFPHCTYGSFGGECTIYNSESEDISCWVNINGQTASGRPVSGFEYKTIYSRSYAWIKVYSNDSQDPIRYLQANASCNTI